MTIEDAPITQRIDAQEQHSYRAECLKTTEEYREYLTMIEAVEKRNKAIIEGNREQYIELTKVLEGECCGDC